MLPTCCIYYAFVRQASLKKARKNVLGDPGGAIANDPAMLLSALSGSYFSVRDGKPTDSALFNTGVATGIAFSWTTECQKHKGKSAPFEKDCKYSSPSALQVVSTPGVRNDVQTILNGMVADVDPKASRDFHAWHHTLRDCTWCAEEGKPHELALHKARLHEDGPSHFFVQTEVAKRPRYDVAEGVSPSLSVDVFGKFYSLCAIVYATMGGHHFVSQVYPPEHKCWVIYNDAVDSEAYCYARFQADYNQGHKHMFLYMEQDVLKKLDCLEAHAPLRGSGSSSPPKQQQQLNIPAVGEFLRKGPMSEVQEREVRGQYPKMCSSQRVGSA